MTDPAAPARFLQGIRVLLTRPADQIAQTADEVRRAGGAPILCPLLRRAPPAKPDSDRLMTALRAGPAACAFTSTNAVSALAEWAVSQRQDLRLLLARSCVAAVGDRTAQALAEHGIEVSLIAPQATGEALAAAMLRLPELRGGRVLLPRAQEGREALAEALAGAGMIVDAVTVYRMEPSTETETGPGLLALREARIDAVPIGSPRTAALLLEALGEHRLEILRRVVVGAIGRTTATALEQAGVVVDVVAQPATFSVLLRAVAGAVRRKWDQGSPGA